MPMTQESDHILRKASQRVIAAKHQMDVAQVALNRAEDEWFEACRDLERLENLAQRS